MLSAHLPLVPPFSISPRQIDWDLKQQTHKDDVCRWSSNVL